MPDRVFKIEADFEPAGDQPEAIRALVEGLNDGLAHQTLLGVTGSGKSIGYDDPLLILERRGESVSVRVHKAGIFIDGLVESECGDQRDAGETVILGPPLDRQIITIAFDPGTGKSGAQPVSAFTRHTAPDAMFRLSTRCGREVTLTGDHSLWVLREGRLLLIRTTDVLPGDWAPLPERIDYTGSLGAIDVLPILTNSGLFVQAEEEVLAYEEEYGRPKIAAALRAATDVEPLRKLWTMRRKVRGQGIRVESFLELLKSTGGLGGHHSSCRVRIGAKRAHNSIPGELPLTPLMLKLFGYYVAEGNCQRGYFVIANRHPSIRRNIKRALDEFGVPFSVRKSSDLQVSSTALTTLFSRLCGAIAQEKRLPYFWASLSNESLGHLLRAYFDGDGGVEKPGRVVAVSASKELVSDLCYAIMRFGIWGRIRKIWKRARNSDHRGNWYFEVCISGQDDLARYSENIGFDIPEKSAALANVQERAGNTNVDVVPIDGAMFRWLRKALGVSMARVAGKAGCSRPAISLIESGDRYPSRNLLRKLLFALREFAAVRRIRSMEWEKGWQSMDRLVELRWSPITGVEKIGYPHPYVYDLSVPGSETFLAGHGGLFVHNTYTIANVVHAVQRPTLILAPNKTLAAQLYGEMREFFPHNAVEYFVSYYDYYQPEAYVPSTDTYIEKDASINEHIEQMRLSATKALLEHDDAVIVATVSAIYGLGDPEAFHSMVLHLVRGDAIDQRLILRRLAELQYTRNETELRRGTYRVRGEIIDIYPAESDKDAVRVELFDDEIEHLSFFDPLTGEVQRRVPRLTIYPKSHYVTPRQTIVDAVEHIKVELEERLAWQRSNGKLLEAQRLEQRTRFDIEMMVELGFCKGIENYSRFLSGRAPGEPPPTLFDYLPDKALLVIDESHVTVPQLGGMYRGDRSRKETLVEYGFRLPSALDNRPLRFDEFEALAPQIIFVSATPGAYEGEHCSDVVEQVVRPTGLVDPAVEVRPASTQVDDLLSEIHRRVEVGERVLVTTLTKRMAEDLTDYLSEHGVRVRYLHSDIDTVERVEIIRDLRLGEFDVLVGINLLREGLDMPEVSLVTILDADKEGFLRSDRSLIQTIGRAARNINGAAILYADRMTGSMQRALDETGRRREKQLCFNQEHGITPRGIRKAVNDIMEGARSGAPGTPRRFAEVAEEIGRYGALTPNDVSRRIQELEKRMFKHAENLEFEEAAKLRDEAARLRDFGLELKAG